MIIAKAARCIGACSFDAVYNPNSSANELLDRKIGGVCAGCLLWTSVLPYLAGTGYQPEL